jgi:hypothetical protein
MTEFTLFDYDNQTHWENFDNQVALVGAARRAGYNVIEVDGAKAKKGTQRAARLVVQIEDDEEAMFFKLRFM